MDDERAAAKALFDDLAVAHLGTEGVSIGQMFSSEGLAVRGKIFAFPTREGRLVVKVPQARATDLVAEGVVELVSLGGRTMREWVGVALTDKDRWVGLVAEAYAYVDEITD